MRRRQGLLVTEEGGHIDNRQNMQYDSRKSKLTADPRTDPPHLDVFKRDGGTRVTLDPGETYEEVLEKFPHRIPLQPLCFMYFYIIEAPDNAYFGAGNYSIDRAFMQSGTLLKDVIYMDVDTSDLYIRRYAEVDSDRSSSYTFNSDEYLFRIRYMIFSQGDYRTLWGSYKDGLGI